MPSNNRKVPRNVHIYHGEAGDIQVKARASQQTISPTSNPLQPGYYDVYSSGTIKFTEGPYVQRIYSLRAPSGRIDMDAFRDGVRARDRKCVITHVPNLEAEFNEWVSFETAHIFPLAHENTWVEGDYSRWITDMEHRGATAKMNSCQNGLLLAAHIHTAWDLYRVSVNPDDGYKIIRFGIDSMGIDGKILDSVCRDPSNPTVYLMSC